MPLLVINLHISHHVDAPLELVRREVVAARQHWSLPLFGRRCVVQKRAHVASCGDLITHPLHLHLVGEERIRVLPRANVAAENPELVRLPHGDHIGIHEYRLVCGKDRR